MPYPSSRGYSVSEQGSQLMIQGFFSRLLADLHLLPFFLISWCKFHLVVVCLFSYVQLFWTPWTAACQASLSFTISWSLLKLMSIESLMPSNHLILGHPLRLPSVFPSIRVFSNESALRIRWPKYWSFSFSISPSVFCSLLNSFRL